MSKKNVYDRIVEWFDVKFGFAKTPLRAVPLFTLNPTYWLGALLAVTFVMQGITGMFMLLYYVPDPTKAYSSTMSIINTVPLGMLVETLHLYTAYAMIFLTFLHLVRNYFGSSFKENRDLMWVAGIILGGIVVSFGVTGYLLPWTVISKSATDVAIGFTNFLPGSLGSLAKFLAVGSGSDIDQLRRFVTIHTVILPAALLLFLGLKVYMYEVHGPSYVPAYGKLKVPGGKYVHWFPRVFLYGVMLISVYVAVLLAVSSMFPLSLPPEFSAAAAAQYVVQPDWYLLWVYQILKIQAFEGPEAVFALAGITLFLVILLLLPFYDRTKRRDMSTRPLFATVGAILVSEAVALTAWGYLTPGQVISNVQAVALLGGLAVVVAIVAHFVYRIYRKTHVPATPPTTSTPTPSRLAHPRRQRLTAFLGQIRQGLLSGFTVVFVAFLALASASASSLVNMLPNFVANLPVFLLSAVLLAVSTCSMVWMLKRFVSAYEAGGRVA